MLPAPSSSEVPSSASTIATLSSSSAYPSNATLSRSAAPSSAVTSISSGFGKSATSVATTGANFDHIFQAADQSIPGLGKPAIVSKSAKNLNAGKGRVKKPPVVKRPPPSRTVEHHHHHHAIPVDSHTNLRKMVIDESKVNYLPYNPPVAVDQTGLIQSIGKPFNPNHARFLPDPGDEFMITRRASEVRLKHVKLYGDVNPKIVDGLVATLKLFSVLIGVAGLLFFIYVLAIAALWTPLEFVRYFLDSHPFYKAVYIVGVVQPMAVAPYCRYALLNLKFIRTYFLRVPLSLVFPTGVVLVGLIMFVETVKPSGELHDFMKSQMAHYFRFDHYDSLFAQEAWDGIQKTFACCGYENPNEWLAYNKTHYPKSCCAASNCTVGRGSTDIKIAACGGPYQAVNVVLAIVFISFGGAIGVLEIMSVIFMRSLYACIGKELYDERQSLTIMFGRLCSLCEVEDTDVELEYDYKHKEDHSSSSSDSDDDEQQKRQSKESEVASAAASNTTIDIIDDRPSGTNIAHIGARKVGPAPGGKGKKGKGKPKEDE